jgi:oligoribonuclease NrnB/cAMP/cGMP phosphodiesterase (DHH superfamily)
MVKNKIVYHEADLDGVTSAAIMLLESEFKEEELELIPYDYDKEFSKKKTEGHVIYMVDVSLNCPELFEVSKLAAEFYLIDHHVSFHDNFLLYCDENNITYSKDSFGVASRYTIKDFNFTYFYSSSYSACELMMKLFGHNLKDESKKLISLLGQYDTWRNTNDKKFTTDQDWDKVVLPVQYALKAYMNPESMCKVLYNLDNGGSKYGLDKLISEGNSILNFLKSENLNNLKNSFNFDLQGLRILALNTNRFTSFTFDAYWNPDLFDAMLAFSFTGKDWKLSLYTTKTDVDILKIATFFGGGGHRGACGFRLPHNQISFRKGKIELGLLLTLDLDVIPQSFKGMHIMKIKEFLYNQPIQLLNTNDVGIELDDFAPTNQSNLFDVEELELTETAVEIVEEKVEEEVIEEVVESSKPKRAPKSIKRKK